MEHDVKKDDCCGSRSAANDNLNTSQSLSVANVVQGQRGRRSETAPSRDGAYGEPVAQRALNRTGMPDNLKSGLEQMSGIDMSDITVHRNSDKPADVGALAYTQGSNIYLGPGQEHHLPHESWHAVQQKQRRVQPTTQAAGLPVNDDNGLENEASVMGEKAKSFS